MDVLLCAYILSRKHETTHAITRLVGAITLHCTTMCMRNNDGQQTSLIMMITFVVHLMHYYTCHAAGVSSHTLYFVRMLVSMYNAPTASLILVARLLCMPLAER
jgi:hypothetical protein